MNNPQVLGVDSGVRATIELPALLESTLSLLKQSRGREAISGLCLGLTWLRQQQGNEEFESNIIPACRSHELFQWIQQDPYSRRAFEKPRGYAGDAVMLDFIYNGRCPPNTSPEGQVVFEGTTGTSNANSVLQRRGILASTIDEVATDKPQPTIASLAAGHLREAELCVSARSGQIGQWLAIDQDVESLAQIKRLYPALRITCIAASVVEFLRGRLKLGPIDLFYSAGLFDYLSERLATKAVSAMFNHLAPGGRLVVSNFTPDSAGRDFMTAFMDWQLVYRDERAMEALLRSLPQNRQGEVKIFRDTEENIVYLQITKAG